jgi:Domain of unknown function (DUF4148)
MTTQDPCPNHSTSQKHVAEAGRADAGRLLRHVHWRARGYAAVLRGTADGLSGQLLSVLRRDLRFGRLNIGGIVDFVALLIMSRTIFVGLVIVASAIAAPALSFAQSNAPLTRAEVRAELVRVEQASYTQRRPEPRCCLKRSD